ncbi:hypothetical protein MMC25_004730 [Agyrium rufum]|nr:hypothetical protein [Agyrium rufum]
MSTDYKFSGWMGLDEKSVDGNLKEQEYEPKKWSETDIDIKISHCGVCGSDIHTLRSGWGATVGTAVKVGKEVKNIKVGDRVGVGAQSDSCLKPDCEECSNSEENYCEHMIGTYNGKWPDGSKSYGGYADYWRGPSHFVLKIPDSIASEDAAPMLCGGITLFAPLKKNGCGPGKKVGIVGIGGLGHFGLLYAKALGADKVVAISRSSSKKDDALKMGADDFIATGEDKEWATHHARSLDLIVSTVSSPDMPLAEYLQLLRPKGTFVQVGAPEDSFPPLSAFNFIAKEIALKGSMIGSPSEIAEMLDLTAKQNIKPWTQKIPLKDANKAVPDFIANKPRYRFVLVNEKHASL